VHPIPEEEIQMSRIARTISTIALVVATAGLIAPAAQAKADGLYPHVAPKVTVVGIWEHMPPQTGNRGAWLEHRALANPVDTQTTAVTGRAISTGGGIDWTFPVMGAVALALVMMILGEQVLVRRGRLAT
jgi:hypothetical protein